MYNFLKFIKVYKLYTTCMNKNNIRNILKDEGYSKGMIDSIMSGRRKPNSDLRYKFESLFAIPFKAWVDIKLYLQNNDTKQTRNNTSIKG